MVGLPYDFLANPLGAVRLTFDKAMASGSDPTTLDGKDWGAADLFREFLFDNGGLSQVPLLNASTIKWVQPNTLVRFRGMIQDMLGNEFYVGAYKDGDGWKTNKYADVSQIPTSSSPDMRVWERRLLCCVPVPGQNSWTESSSNSMINPCTSPESLQREKRQREDDTAMEDADMNAAGPECEDSPCAKRMREDGAPFPSANFKESSSSMTVFDTDQNSFPCLVKIYDTSESVMKLNDVFEFVGVFTCDPELTSDINVSDETENSLCEDELVDLPPSKVPRLHCLVHRKLAAHDFLPDTSLLELKSDVVKCIREALLGHLTAVLGNDGLAAQFMLLHLLSRVHARVDSIAVGKFSLNLTGFSKESVSIFGNRLNLVMKNLLPFTHCIPLSVNYLNSVSLAPKKDYQINRLLSGPLQLAEGSHVTVDETLLQAGTLNSTGVENVRLLKSLMDLQKVEYDFTYYKMEMAADVQMLVLSEGKSNILPADLVLPFCPSTTDLPSDVDGEALKAWRWYLATMKALSNNIGPEMQNVVENDLVAARQADRSMGSQEFSRLLTMGRLVSVSFGENSLSLEHWQMVKELDRLRRERLLQGQQGSR